MHLNDILTILLDMKSIETGKVILPNQILAVYNWGSKREEIIGYGWFEWDDFERKFVLQTSQMLSRSLGYESFNGIEDSSDTFLKATYRSLNKEEISKLEDYIVGNFIILSNKNLTF